MGEDHHEWFRRLVGRRVDQRRNWLTTDQERHSDPLIKCFDSREAFENRFPDEIQRQHMLETLEAAISNVRHLVGSSDRTR
jgi:hypothetical protein